jgi:hypothetical protein
MALVERLAILITGDASGAINEMKKVATEAEKNAAKADATASKFSGTATKIGAGMVAAGASLLAVGVSAANTTIDLGTQVRTLQRYTGMNAESASKLAYAAKISGIDVEALAIGIGKLSKSMADSPDKLSKLGIEAKGSDGKLRSMTDVLGDVADRFKTMGPGTEATAAALDLFGRSGANLLPFLFKGKDGLAELSTEAEKMGVVLGQNEVDNVTKYKVAQRQLGAAIDGVKVQIGNEMLPILTKFTELITNLPGPVKDVAGPIVVLGGAALVTGGAFVVMAGQVQNAKASLASMSDTTKLLGTALGVVTAGIAVGTAVASFLDQQDKKYAERLKPFMDKTLGDFGKESLQQAGQAFNNLNDQVGQTHAKWWHFWESDFWTGKTGGMNQAAAATRDALGIMVASVVAIGDATGDSSEKIQQWISDQQQAGTTFPSVAAALAAYTGKIDVNKLSAEDAAGAQNAYTTSIKNANDALRATVDPYFAVTKAQRDLNDANKALTEAQSKYAADSPEVQSAFEAQVTAGEDLVQKLGELGDKQRTNGASAEMFKTALDTLRVLGIDPASEAGRVMIERITGIQTTASGVADWLNHNPLHPNVDQSAIDNFLNALEAIKRKHAEVQDFIFEHPLGSKDNGLGIIAPKAPGRASGGFAPGGRATLVGEHGPELFIPSSSGSVVNALSTSHAMAGGDGGSTMTINITMPPGSDGADVVEAIRKYERMNGTGWRN